MNCSSRGGVFPKHPETPASDADRRTLAGYPTVLIAIHDDELRRVLLGKLDRNNCLVLEADNIDFALHTVKVHSRTIHVAVLDARTQNSVQGQVLGKHRPGMHIILLSPGETGLACDQGRRDTGPVPIPV